MEPKKLTKKQRKSKLSDLSKASYICTIEMRDILNFVQIELERYKSLSEELQKLEKQMDKLRD